jgi:dolichol-phosphate mannosyltransferase
MCANQYENVYANSQKDPKRPKTIAIIPAFNEEGKIGWVVERAVKHQPALLDTVLVLIDNKTTDNSAGEAEEKGAFVIRNAGDGVGSVLKTGLRYALEKDMEICVLIAGDAQDDPAELPNLIYPIVHEGFDFVQGSRYLDGQRTVDMPLIRAILTRIYTLGFRAVTGFPATDASNGFRALRLSNLKKINLWQKGLDKYGLENFLFAQTIKRKFKIKEVPVTKRFDRKQGYSHMNLLIDHSFWSVIKGRIE